MGHPRDTGTVTTTSLEATTSASTVTAKPGWPGQSRGPWECWTPAVEASLGASTSDGGTCHVCTSESASWPHRWPQAAASAGSHTGQRLHAHGTPPAHSPLAPSAASCGAYDTPLDSSQEAEAECSRGEEAPTPEARALGPLPLHRQWHVLGAPLGLGPRASSHVPVPVPQPPSASPFASLSWSFPRPLFLCLALPNPQRIQSRGRGHTGCAEGTAAAHSAAAPTANGGAPGAAGAGAAAAGLGSTAGAGGGAAPMGGSSGAGASGGVDCVSGSSGAAVEAVLGGAVAAGGAGADGHGGHWEHWWHSLGPLRALGVSCMAASCMAFSLSPSTSPLRPFLPPSVPPSWLRRGQAPNQQQTHQPQALQSSHFGASQDQQQQRPRAYRQVKALQQQLGLLVQGQWGRVDRWSGGRGRRGEGGFLASILWPATGARALPSAAHAPLPLPRAAPGAPGAGAPVSDSGAPEAAGTQGLAIHQSHASVSLRPPSSSCAAPPSTSSGTTSSTSSSTSTGTSTGTSTSSSTSSSSSSTYSNPPPGFGVPPESTRQRAQRIAASAEVGWSGFIRPVDRVWEISSGFGPRWGRNHNGVDLAAPTGEPVLAADGGEVTYSGWEPTGFGYLVEITHDDGWRTLYGHNSKLYAWTGKRVKRGECIALVGETGKATGPHLHWEIRKKDGFPVDPAKYVHL